MVNASNAKEMRLINIQFKQRSKRMKKLITVGLVMMVAIIGLMIPTTAEETTHTTVEIEPISFTGFVPCAIGGVGEEVEVTGNLLIVEQVTLDENGGFHLVYHENPMGVSGIGSTSSDKYRAVGVYQYNVYGMVGEVENGEWNFLMIGQGPGNNLLIHANFHVTVHPDGTVTSFHDNLRIECK